MITTEETQADESTGAGGSVESATYSCRRNPDTPARWDEIKKDASEVGLNASALTRMLILDGLRR